MKKILLQVVAIFALSALTFSCGNEGQQAETATTPQAEAQVEPQAQPAEEPQVEEATASATNEIDAFLDEYESLGNTIIDWAKKVKSASTSDPMAAMEMMESYQRYIDKAGELDQKAESLKGNMTPEQLNRLVKIVNNVNKAASSMY